MLCFAADYQPAQSNLVVASRSEPHEETGTHAKSDADAHHGYKNLGEDLPLWSCIPFALMLLSIALFPLLAPEFWHHHFGKVSAFWAASLALPFLIVHKGTALYEILHIVLADYVPFHDLSSVRGTADGFYQYSSFKEIFRFYRV